MFALQYKRCDKPNYLHQFANINSSDNNMKVLVSSEMKIAHKTINMQSSHYSFQFAALCLVASTAAAGIYGHGYGHGYAHGYAYPLADSVPAAVNGLQVSETS